MANKLMINFEFLVHATQGATPAKIEVMTENPGPSIIEFVEGTQIISVNVQDVGSLDLDFFSKTETDTLFDSQGNIIGDTEFRIETVWCDGIRLEPWFNHSCEYTPRYFSGFLSQFPDSPATIVAPYQFNFPGQLHWAWTGDFWEWYFVEKNNREVINFLDKDPDRVWKFRGSLDPCEDLVAKLKALLV